LIPIATYLEARRAEVEEALQRVLPPGGAAPSELADAMRYSTLAGGKRIRPILVLASAEACGVRDVRRDELVEAASSLELIHTYSLIHDDLPCMDDDRLRRGKPTCHVVFGEAMALLAGDSLQSLGFEILATRPSGPGMSQRRAEAVELVAKAIGHAGMAGGQAMDILATGRESHGPAALEEPLLRSMHAKKTGSLLRASIEVGAAYAGVEPARRHALRRYGESLGLVFQIADDILDVTADARTLGKTAGKDAAQAKLTYPSLLGLEGARRRLEVALDSALNAAVESGDPEGVLDGLARFAATRTS
jgi:farnesyl diphosphate synthase